MEITSLIPKTRRAEKYHKTFLKKIEKRLKGLYEFPLTVFLCGPSKNTDELLYNKRLETVNQLRERHIDAITGEDGVEELKALDISRNRPLRKPNIYEKEMALASDLVTIFYEGSGAIAETHEFLKDKKISEKTVIWVNEKYKDGYCSEGAIASHGDALGNIFTYKYPEDIIACNVRTHLIQIVEDYRALSWWQNKL